MNLQEGKTVIRAVIFDMFETLITHYHSPLYFGAQMAEDAGIPEDKFQSLWHPTERERSIGKLTLEEVLEMILRENHCYSETIQMKIVDKRIAAKEECFRHLHTDIIPMLSALKKRGLLVGLISNCFSEEAYVIRRSEIFTCFDGIYRSYEQGIQKPDEEIFQRCMDGFSVKAEECIYVGDGGSNELETARKLGMKAVQAAWYLQEGTTQPSKRKQDFIQIENPLDVLNFIDL
jgi:putative hydrolase of the HAD superfamily